MSVADLVAIAKFIFMLRSRVCGGTWIKILSVHRLRRADLVSRLTGLIGLNPLIPDSAGPKPPARERALLQGAQLAER